MVIYGRECPGISYFMGAYIPVAAHGPFGHACAHKKTKWHHLPDDSHDNNTRLPRPSTMSHSMQTATSTTPIPQTPIYSNERQCAWLQTCHVMCVLCIRQLACVLERISKPNK